MGAAAPLQQAGATALRLPETYYQSLCQNYQARRDRMLAGLEQAGFRCFQPQGAYYVMTDISGFGFADDMAFGRHLVENIGVAAVPGSCFFSNPRDGDQLIRFCFPKRPETLQAASDRLQKLSG